MKQAHRELLDRIRDVVQDDVNDRGLRRDASDNLLCRTKDDFAAACAGIAATPRPSILILTGFYVPHGKPPAAETDGPLGAVWLARALAPLGIAVTIAAESWCSPALSAGVKAVASSPIATLRTLFRPDDFPGSAFKEMEAPLAGLLLAPPFDFGKTHVIALERVGPNYTPELLRERPETTESHVTEFTTAVSLFDHDRCFSMSGRDITGYMAPTEAFFDPAKYPLHRLLTIGIGDGGNEIGMGKIPWDVIRRNIPRGELIACRIPTDHLIVAGVSNWGAYALGAGVRLLRGAKFDPELFDIDRERAILARMVEDGPLVDGVTGRQTVTVDGLDFDRYAQPLRRIGELLREAS